MDHILSHEKRNYWQRIRTSHLKYLYFHIAFCIFVFLDQSKILKMLRMLEESELLNYQIMNRLTI